MLIGRELRYIEGWHQSLKGMTVKIVAVHRGESSLEHDDFIGELQDGDWLEIVPIIDDGGAQRASWVTYDALPAHLHFKD